MNSVLRDFDREQIILGLAKLPEANQNMFRRMYGSHLPDASLCEITASIPDDTLDWALTQVQNTLKIGAMDKSHCAGCRNDFYNGNNPHSIQQCWSLKDATLVAKKKVHRDQVPPWNQAPIVVPSCYHCEGYVFVSPDRIN